MTADAPATIPDHIVWPSWLDPYLAHVTFDPLLVLFPDESAMRAAAEAELARREEPLRRRVAKARAIRDEPVPAEKVAAERRKRETLAAEAEAAAQTAKVVADAEIAAEAEYERLCRRWPLTLAAVAARRRANEAKFNGRRKWAAFYEAERQDETQPANRAILYDLKHAALLAGQEVAKTESAAAAAAEAAETEVSNDSETEAERQQVANGITRPPTHARREYEQRLRHAAWARGHADEPDEKIASVLQWNRYDAIHPQSVEWECIGSLRSASDLIDLAGTHVRRQHGGNHDLVDACWAALRATHPDLPRDAWRDTIIISQPVPRTEGERRRSGRSRRRAPPLAYIVHRPATYPPYEVVAAAPQHGAEAGTLAAGARVPANTRNEAERLARSLRYPKAQA